MSKNKRVNPNKIPISKDSFDIQQLLTETTQQNVYRAWVLALGAFADYYDTTTESLLHLWEIVNDYTTAIEAYEDISTDLKVVDRVLCRTLPNKNISTEGIKTQGDLGKLKRRLQENALYAGFCLIAHPLIDKEVFPEERIKDIFDRVYGHEEAISQKRYTLADLVHNLENEYRLLVVFKDNNVRLKKI